MSWFRIAFDDAITHAVPGSLLSALVIDMASRGHPIKNYERAYGIENARSLGDNPAAITEWAFDLGGMWIDGTPTETFTVDGLTVDVPCNHFSDVLSALKRIEMRRFADGSHYYKLHHWHHATVLNIAHKTQLVVEMTKREHTAMGRYKDFYAEVQRKRQAVSR